MANPASLCPRCGHEQTCPCDSCQARTPTIKPWVWTSGDDIRCGNCTFEASADWWQDNEMVPLEPESRIVGTGPHATLEYKLDLQIAHRVKELYLGLGCLKHSLRALARDVTGHEDQMMGQDLVRLAEWTLGEEFNKDESP